MVTRHPLYFYNEVIKKMNVNFAKNMPRLKGKKVKMVGWYMTSKRIRTRKGEIMKFLSLEDLTGTFEAVIFPNIYMGVAEKTMSMGPYIVEGVVDVNDSTNLIVKKLDVLSSIAVKALQQKDSVGNKYYGDVEKVNESDFVLIKNLGEEKLRTAYAG